MRHFRTRYSMFKHEPNPDWPSDCIYAVVDHQTGKEVERGLTWLEAHDTIDELTGIDTSPPIADEYPELSDGWRTRAMARSGAFG